MFSNIIVNRATNILSRAAVVALCLVLGLMSFTPTAGMSRSVAAAEATVAEGAATETVALPAVEYATVRAALQSCRGTSEVKRRWWGVEVYMDSCATEEMIAYYGQGKVLTLICADIATKGGHWILRALCAIPSAYINIPYFGFRDRMKRAYEDSYRRRGVILFQPWAGPGYFAPQ